MLLMLGSCDRTHYNHCIELAPDIIDRTLHSPHGEAALQICELLHLKGFEALWVGGCIRDMFLGSLPEDIDIATSAKPDQIEELFQKSDTHAAHLGSIIVSKSGHTFEITSFRKDHDVSDGRYPESVEFADKDEDAKRRDITINAIYWNPVSGELYDPFDGITDLHEGLIRFIGNPEARIEHDALRLLRVIRFRSYTNGQYHPDTYQALHKLSKNIEVLSGERRFEELQKMLLGPYPHIAFEDLWETDILEHLMPELHKCKGVAQPKDYHKEGDVWNHTLQCIEHCNHDHGIDVRLAALFHDVGKAETFSIKERIRFDEHASVSSKIARSVLERLKCSNKRIDKICWLIEHHMMMGVFTDLSVERKAHWYYHPWFIELLQLFWIDIAGTTPSHFDLYDDIVNDYNHFLDEHPLPPRPLLNGEEVMQILGIQPGAKVGEVLSALKDAQVKKEITKKAEAIAFVESYIDK